MSEMVQKLVLDDLVDAAALAPWLDLHAPELGTGPIRMSLMYGGTSNVIVEIQRRDGPRAIVRRTPVDAPPGSARSMMREARILEALGGTDVPHPHLYARCEDVAILGAPFYVMQLVEGWSGQLTQADCLYQPPFDRPDRRGEVMFAMVDGIAALANVDHVAAGLGDFGNPDGFLDRQVTRWRSQLADYPTKYPGWIARPLPWLEEVSDWLANNRPPPSRAGILHGDFGAPNCIFAPDPPARLLAILDWELSTIGDPLLDLGLLTYTLKDRRTGDRSAISAYFDTAGMPTRQDVAERYGRRTGRDVSGLDYYMVLSQFKLACICEYKVARAAVGLESPGVGAMFESLVPRLLEECHAIIGLSAARD